MKSVEMIIIQGKGRYLNVYYIESVQFRMTSVCLEYLFIYFAFNASFFPRAKPHL